MINTKNVVTAIFNLHEHNCIPINTFGADEESFYVRLNSYLCENELASFGIRKIQTFAGEVIEYLPSKGLGYNGMVIVQSELSEELEIFINDIKSQ